MRPVARFDTVRAVLVLQYRKRCNLQFIQFYNLYNSM